MNQTIREYKFYHVDVFAEQRFGGNPVAVFPDADGLTEEEMQAIAFELNIAETAFVFPPTKSQANHRVRIFTPVQELPFAGHPTIGTHYVLATLNRFDLRENPTRVYQEVGVSVLPVDIYSEHGQVGKITMTQKEPRFLEFIDDLELLAQGLCCDVEDLDLDFANPRVVSTGLPCIMVPVKSLEVLGDLGLEVGSLREVCDQHNCEMAYAFTIRQSLRPGSDAQARFFSAHLLFEDAATGSAAGALGAFLTANGLNDDSGISHFVVDQGDYLGRPSRIYVTVNRRNPDEATKVEVSGYCRPVFDAVLRLEF